MTIALDPMIKLMKSTFYREEETKRKLCDFIMDSEKLTNGDQCKAFQQAFAQYQGRKYAVLYNSGSSANLALIQALINQKDLKRGDKVGFSAVTWATNVMPLIQLGLEPVPVDISSRTLNVHSDALSEAIKEKDLKAYFATNLLGFSGDLDKIRDVCDSRGTIFLEDNCESLGSELGGKKLGNFGLASTFSLFVGHHMSTIEGGLVCTDDEKLYDSLIMTRAHGWSRDIAPEKAKALRNKHDIDAFNDKYTFYTMGYNFRPTEITGFLGLNQLTYMDEINKIRSENYKKFKEAAATNSDFSSVDASHMSFVSNFAYPLVFDTPELFENYKKSFEAGVEIRPIVSGSTLHQPFFMDYMKERGVSYECPNAQKIHNLGFYFPNNPELTQDEVSYLTNLLRKK